MTRMTRRFALNAAMASALMPALSLGGVLRAAVPRGFTPPTQPMRLSRMLNRELGDGAAISVTRRWIVQFETVGRGYRLSGEQDTVEVSAPPSLASFARLEESRIEQSLFPLMFDSDGQITGSTAAGNVLEQLDEAIRQAADRIGQRDSNSASSQFLASLRRSAEKIIQRVPRDLFFPTRLDWETRRDIAIPGGDKGEIIVRFLAELADGGGIVRRAARTITTVIGESQRSSREEWTLLPV